MSASAIDDDLFDSVAADYLARFRSGERPSVDDYASRYPEVADEIRELFPTMLAIERMKLQKEHSSDGRASLGARRIERLGDFRIIREIGRGGMGVVFEAEQQSLGRRVALKVLPPNALLDEAQVRRFHREARAAAALHHTNIVPVFGVGEEEGLHYYVMQLIDGEPLDRWVQAGHERPMEARRAAGIVRQIADAVQFAHDHGTLHRDIKPANLLLDRTGNVWITDFGLALLREREETVTDHVAGTLRYMAPERFRGIADEASDQYSLGITLYELVTGTRAFEGSSSGELLHRITQNDPIAARTYAPQLPRDLETIIEKAISKDPGHRYARVGDFAADLQRFLDGLPIHARRILAPERVWRWCRRNRALAAALAAVAVLLLLVVTLPAIGYIRSSRLNAELSQSLIKEQAALTSERVALDNERTARDKERQAREAAESIANLALEGLDRVFDEFAPAAPYTIALTTPGNAIGVEEDEPLLLPAQATVSPQVATALERLLPLYRRLADETGQDPRVRLRAASAQHRLGLIYRQLGRQDSALAAFWAARSMLETLRQEGAPLTDGYVLELARVLNDLGELERQVFRGREALDAHRQALAIVRQLDNDSPSGESRLELARTHYLLSRRDLYFGGPGGGFGPGGASRGSASRDGFRERGPDGRVGAPTGAPAALATESGAATPAAATPAVTDSATPAPPPRPSRTGASSDRGSGGPRSNSADRSGGNDRGAGDRGAGDRGGSDRGSGERPRSGGGSSRGGQVGRGSDEPRQHLARAIALLENFPHADRDTRALLLLARCYREQASQRDRDEVEQRQQDRAGAIAILQGLVDESPNVLDFRFELSEVYADGDPRWYSDDRLSDAEVRLKKALDLSRELIAEAPQIPAYSAGLTQILQKQSFVYRRTNRTELARQALLEAIAVQSGLAREFPESAVHTVWKGRLQRYLADLLLNEGRFEEAATLLRESAAAIEPLVASQDRRNDPAAMFAWVTLGETYRMLSDVLRDQGDVAGADEAAAQAARFAPPWFNRRPPPDTP